MVTGDYSLLHTCHWQPPAVRRSWLLPSARVAEQTTGDDRITGASKTANALHLTLSVPAVITADVIIAHAFVGVTCN